MLALVYVGGISAVYFAPESSEVATWWPAAGISVVLLVLSPRSWWPALAVGIAVSSGLANLTAGRTLELSALFGVASAFCWALALIITRKISNSDTPQTTVLWSAGIGTAVLSLILPFQAIWPTPKQLGLSLVLGVLASGGQ